MVEGVVTVVEEGEVTVVSGESGVMVVRLSRKVGKQGMRGDMGEGLKDGIPVGNGKEGNKIDTERTTSLSHDQLNTDRLGRLGLGLGVGLGLGLGPGGGAEVDPNSACRAARGRGRTSFLPTSVFHPPNLPKPYTCLL
ncbi:hypothetical protein Pcinc_020641 [Petrolisthes cinctipes]|uniref:Uncharacterized protein n=1 Tax=Petrolisthes cinctipes TaxID=88211 RepID=A0AAE1FJU9_PETCI|nr:hypothetical protein Pcinc_020641 [Petrolisthes cinctipes]